MPIINSTGQRSRAGFNLVELLTVIAIIAVLASLMLTGLASAKKRSRTMVCTANLHQFAVALNLYLDSNGGNRPALSDLVAGNYLSSPQSLICPEDKTGNWGQLVTLNGFVATAAPNSVPTPNYSYLLYPLGWSSAEWKSLVNAGSRAGIAACQLHGLGTQDNPSILNYSGLLLRAQLDGSVIRRQFFWNPLSDGPPPVVIPAGLGGNPTDALYPLQLYFDDPASWQNYQ